MSVVVQVLLLAALASGHSVEGPCKAVHYARNNYEGTTMSHVVAKRQRPGTSDYVPSFRPRPDVSGFIAVRNADQWRIARNYRALVIFKLPTGGWSQAIWLQPADYQKASDMTSRACRVETSAALAINQGWSIYQGWGRTTAYIVRWER